MHTAIHMVAPDAPLERVEHPTPDLAPGAVLLDTLGSEVCGTDVHLWHGRLAGVPYPIIPGHVSVGRVAATGGEVRDLDGVPLAPGDVVTFLDVWGSCGRCWHCTVAKATTRCPERRVYGITMGAEEGLFGGWAEAIHLLPGTHVMRLPEELPWELVLAAGCGLPTSIHAVERAEIALGDSVVVQGAGPVGLCAAILAQLRGATRVIVIGGPALRLEMARRAGADATIDIGAHDEAARRERVLDLTGGRGADVTIEATGVAAAVPEGMRLTRDAGRYVVVGQYTDVGETSFNPHRDLNRKHLEIRGCWGSDVSHVYRALQVLARTRDRFPWADFVTARYGLGRAQEALEAVAAQREVKALILPGEPDS